MNPNLKQPGMKKTKQLAADPGTETHADRLDITDWARFVSFQPQLYFRPQDLDELKSFLTGLQQGMIGQRNVRVLGGLHSCSEICVSDTIIDVSDLPKSIEFDADHTTVTVSANWHLHDFLAELSEHGKSINATGGTDKQTLAGLISTDTAPATPKYAIYDLLERVEYITIDEARNSVLEKRVTKADPAFSAVVASLGAIGILTKVQFRLVDEPYFETRQKIIKLKEVLSDVSQTSQKYEFWRIDWIPDTDEGLLWAANRIPKTDSDGDYPVDQSENILQSIFAVLDKIESAGPILDNAMRLVYAGLTLTYGEIVATGPLRNMLPVDRRVPLHVAMAEWSFNPAELDKILNQCKEYFQQNGWPNLPIEIELTKTDNYFMSPWNWQGLDYIVKLNFMYLTDVSSTEQEKDQIIAHLQGLWNHFLKNGIRFKAHWGKINFIDYDFVRSRYEIDRFKPFMRSLFLNTYLTVRLNP
jgi:hypothetical protein